MRKSSSTSSRTRARYTLQACDVCRAKKIRCDGLKDICGQCVSSKRQAECAWTKQPVRKPRTEAHFEALRKRADALESYTRLLERQLATCRCRTAFGYGSSSQGGGADAAVGVDEEAVEEEPSDERNQTDITQELCVPTAKLKLEDRDLLFHGITTPFRFSSTTTARPAPSPAATFGSYILMIEGVDESQCDPTFDWSRYLPHDILFDRKEHDRLLDLVFKFFTSWCMRIVPALFLRDMYRYLTHPDPYPHKLKTSHYSPMLHNALLALGSAYSDDPKVRSVTARRAIVAHAKSFIEAEVARPDISVVNALAIVGSFHSSHGEMMLGWTYFGMSIRISQSLGLSIDTVPWVRSGLITKTDMVDRNWTYWITFTQDVCWSLYVGRDLTVPAPPSAKYLRPVSGEGGWFDELDEAPVSYACPPGGTKQPAQPNYLGKVNDATCDLLLIATKIMAVINNLGRKATRQEVADKIITDIESVLSHIRFFADILKKLLSVQLHTWKSQLQAEVDITPLTRETSTPHRLMMHAAYWWCFILLHRPFFHQKLRPAHGSDPQVDHVKLCKRAAENIMELLEAWRKLYGLRFSQVTLVSDLRRNLYSRLGLSFLLLAANSTSPTRSRIASTSLRTALTQVELCIQYLGEIGQTWQTGNLMGNILRNLLIEQIRPLLEKRRAGEAARDNSKDRTPPDNLTEPSVITNLTTSLAPASLDFDSMGHPSNSMSPLPTSLDDLFLDSVTNSVFEDDSIPLPDFLQAMLGPEPIPDAPYMPPFDLGYSNMELDFGLDFANNGVGDLSLNLAANLNWDYWR
ncbi:hypothetical protein MIND_01241800 [Mycena indigotica]|uniref:Zn(2)-C6 fungal-type domain-containing protein n=1 Tax=Mycena indigotica TaxID=2126181 RepID=A0A8H6S4F3_9AGAR|nr:uncharacterized protein MIND_01241800 [Mycena indigotica]KAF7292148.1 hypothetical protein MIND_01241800 [Mycena indigotica]